MFNSVINDTDHYLLDSLHRLGHLNSWCLPELYSPSASSFTLDHLSHNFSTSLVVHSRLTLFESSLPGSISLHSGLLTCQNKYLYESNPETRRLNLITKLLARPRLPGSLHRRRRPHTLENNLILLSTHNNPNYFHWFTLPGLAPIFLQQYFHLPIPADQSIAYSPRPRHPLPQFVSQLLHITSPSTPQVSLCSLNSLQTVRFSMQRFDSEVCLSPKQIHWLASRIKSILPSCTKPFRKLFISRSTALKRKCLNEDEIMSHLSPHGFELIDLSNMPVYDQLKLFSESSIVIGTHGAGLTNLLASKPRTHLVELLPSPGPYHHYFLMCSILMIHHAHIIADSRDRLSDSYTLDPIRITNLLCKLSLI